jgi:hypothetical protein
VSDEHLLTVSYYDSQAVKSMGFGATKIEPTCWNSAGYCDIEVELRGEGVNRRGRLAPGGSYAVFIDQSRL